MEEEMKKLQKRYQKEKEQIHARFVAERKVGYVVLTISRRLRMVSLLAASPEPRMILILRKMMISSHNPVTDDNERAVAKLPPDMSKGR